MDYLLGRRIMEEGGDRIKPIPIFLLDFMLPNIFIKQLHFPVSS